MAYPADRSEDDPSRADLDHRERAVLRAVTGELACHQPSVRRRGECVEAATARRVEHCRIDCDGGSPVLVTDQEREMVRAWPPGREEEDAVGGPSGQPGTAGRVQ